MSSDVHAKWMNSLTASSSASLRIFSLRKYSTALTSWLISLSICFTRNASVSENSSAMQVSLSVAVELNGGTSLICACRDSHSNHATSTRTR